MIRESQERAVVSENRFRLKNVLYLYIYTQVRIQVWRMSDSRYDLQPLCAGPPAIIIYNNHSNKMC